LIVLMHGSTITATDIKRAISTDLKHKEDSEARPDREPETKLALPLSILELSERETMATYVKRVKLAVLQTALAKYPNRTAVAERLDLAEETVRKQLRYLGPGPSVRKQHPGGNHE